MQSPKRIIFTGPESSGKSFLSQLVCEKYDFFLVEEYARMYLSQYGDDYNLKDLKKIAEGQRRFEHEAVTNQSKLIVQDTDFLTIWIWYTYKYDIYPDRVYHYLENHIPDHYMLCCPDIPWERDKLRENPEDRDQIYALYKEEIQKLSVPYSIIKGSYKERTEQTFSIIEDLH